MTPPDNEDLSIRIDRLHIGQEVLIGTMADVAATVRSMSTQMERTADNNERIAVLESKSVAKTIMLQEIKDELKTQKIDTTATKRWIAGIVISVLIAFTIYFLPQLRLVPKANAGVNQMKGASYDWSP